MLTKKIFLLIVLSLFAAPLSAQTDVKLERKRVVLLAQGPDGHPETTHEYRAGMQILQRLLEPYQSLSVEIVAADGDWEEGPEQLRAADTVVMFLSEGARWMSENPRRYQAFAELADRRSGIVALHWALGTRAAEPIEPFLQIVGGCHGGPDRRHAIFETRLQPSENSHPLTNGIDAIDVREEFYYRLKFVESESMVQPIMSALIEERQETVAWAWERPHGGRSFGFTGLHFHDNWRHEAYRRLVVQAVLWSSFQEIPDQGVAVAIEQDWLVLESPDEK